MSVTAIVLLVLGVLFFAASFFLPEGKSAEKKEQAVDEKLIKEMVNKEVSEAKSRIEEMVDEIADYSVEKTERQLEKLSNEKIMAVDEYSETVLKRINDNHKEAVFLYDMLNDKGEKLKNSGEELKVKDEELKEKDRRLEVREEVLKAKDEELKEKTQKAEEPSNTFVPFIPERIELRDVEPILPAPAKIKEPVKENKPRTVKKPVTGKTNKLPEVSTYKKAGSDSIGEEPNVELHFDRDNESRKNSNEIIRKMHEEGKSNMAIAKELGLGVGEVKLVIDLFANKK